MYWCDFCLACAFTDTNYGQFCAAVYTPFAEFICLEKSYVADGLFFQSVLNVTSELNVAAIISNSFKAYPYRQILAWSCPLVSI